MYPTSLTLNEDEIARLTKVYQQTQAEILNEIETATDFGVANRKQILAQIDQNLEELGKQAQKTIEKEIPKQYKSGADDAVAQLKNADAPLRVGKGFSRIHNEAIEALVSDTSKAFGESLTGVSRSATQILNKGVKQEITQRLASGQIKGEALREVKKTVIGTIQQQGLYALVDKGGNSWTLDRYTEMLIRTKSVEARNRGLMNRVVENNYDLVQVSSHGASDKCGKWEGKILTVTGKTKGVPSLSDAESGGLFHPNCKHAINVMRPELAKQTMAWDAKNKKYTKGLTNKASTVKDPKATKAVQFAGKNIELNSFETRIAEERGLKVVQLPSRKRSTYGHYSVNDVEIHYGKQLTKNLDHIEDTFRHEFGHFIDYQTIKPTKKIINTGTHTYTQTTSNTLSNKTEFLQAMQPNKEKIIIKRVRADKTNWLGKYSDEDIVKAYRGQKLPYGKEGRMIKLSPKYRRYTQKSEEMFAESYRLYRLEPEYVKKEMPELFDYFKGVVGSE